MSDIGNCPEYLYLSPGGTIPPLNSAVPFKAVIVIDSEVTSDWQAQVSDWLVRSGCLYMMAWGLDCSSWDDSVDYANLKMFGFGKISDDDFVMTTWHEKEPLAEVFWFSEHAAMHPSIIMEKTYIVHIASESRSIALLDEYRAAQAEND